MYLIFNEHIFSWEHVISMELQLDMTRVVFRMSYGVSDAVKFDTEEKCLKAWEGLQPTNGGLIDFRGVENE